MFYNDFFKDWSSMKYKKKSQHSQKFKGRKIYRYFPVDISFYHKDDIISMFYIFRLAFEALEDGR